jgi:hypothetical protein
VASELSGPGPVETGVAAELGTLHAASDRPGLAQTALALARLMDDSRAVNQALAAARVLGSLLDKLRSASARGQRGPLAIMREMATGGHALGTSLGN